MDREEFDTIIQEIGTCADDVERRTKLTALSEKVGGMFDERETNATTINDLNATITKNNEDMEKLRQANMDLFLRIGGKTPAQATADSTGVTDDAESNKPKRKFEDLFKDEGGKQ